MCAVILWLTRVQADLLQDLPDAGAMERIAEPWRPFRSVGCYYMWRVEVPRSLGRATKTKNKSETTKAKKGTGKTAKAKKEPGKASGESREPLGTRRWTCLDECVHC